MLSDEDLVRGEGVGWPLLVMGGGDDGSDDEGGS